MRNRTTRFLLIKLQNKERFLFYRFISVKSFNFIVSYFCEIVFILILQSYHLFIYFYCIYIFELYYGCSLSMFVFHMAFTLVLML